jgi:hypothetical protein
MRRRKKINAVIEGIDSGATIDGRQPQLFRLQDTIGHDDGADNNE